MNNILKMISKMESNANEVKLGKHKVDLSLTSDAEKSYVELKKLYIELRKDSEQYQKLKKQQEDYYEVLKKNFYELKAKTKESEIIQEKLKAAAKELGLSIENAWPQWIDFNKLTIGLANDIRDREQSYLWKNQ